MSTRTPERRPRSASSGEADSANGPALPAWKAFVVQFSQRRTGDIFSGRLEHLHSGRRVEFASREELIGALERLLAEIEATAT